MSDVAQWSVSQVRGGTWKLASLIPPALQLCRGLRATASPLGYLGLGLFVTAIHRQHTELPPHSGVGGLQLAALAGNHPMTCRNSISLNSEDLLVQHHLERQYPRRQPRGEAIPKSWQGIFQPYLGLEPQAGPSVF